MKVVTIILLLVVCLHKIGLGQSLPYFANDLKMVANKTEIQTTERGDTITVASFDLSSLVNQGEEHKTKKYQGTPYYANQWFAGSAKVVGNQETKGLLALDVVKHELKFSMGDKNAYLDINPDRFVMNGITFQKLNDKVKKAGEYYYIILSDSDKNPKLVKRSMGTYVQFKDGEEKALETKKIREYEGKFIKREEYFFVLESKLIKVSKKKSFFKELGKYGSKAQKLIEANKLNLNKASDVLKLSQLLTQ